MKIFRTRLVTVAGLVGAAGLFLNVNCGSSNNGTGTGGTGGGTAGHAGTAGGTAGHAGTAGGTAGTTGGTGGSQGGAQGDAGSTGTGGSVAGSGGSTAGTSGGTAGSGGATAGSGGHAGGAGGSNTDGGTQQYAAFLYTFDKDVQGWGLNAGNTSSGNLSNIEGGVKPTLAWDSSVGSTGTTPMGSLKVDATYSDYLQFAQAVVNIQPTVNATGKEVSVYVMLDAQDGGATWPGNVQVSASTGASYNGFTQVIKSITAGQWMKVELPLTGVASPFDPAQLIQIGVEFTTYSRPEGGTFGPAQHRTFHIDTVTDGTSNPPPPPLNQTFDTSLQGLSLSDSGFKFPDGGTGPALTFDSTIGDPAGSAKLVIPFNAYNQQLDTQINLSPTVDLTGKTIHAKVMLDSGTFPAGYINLHVSAPDYGHYAGATTGSITATTLGTGKWVDLTIVMSAVTLAGFDASKVLQVGIQFGTGGGPEGGAFPTTGEPLTFHIDSIVAQ